MAWANSSKSLVARVRSLGLSLSGVGFPLSTAAPFGMLHIFATLEGQLISSEPTPKTCSKKNLYLLRESFHTTQAGSGLAISSGSDGGSCACSAAEFCSLYPVARPSQKLPP